MLLKRFPDVSYRVESQYSEVALLEGHPRQPVEALTHL